MEEPRPKNVGIGIRKEEMAFQINKDKIAKNTVALYIRMGITMLISFFATRVTLQVLGVEDYGLNNLVGGIVAMFSFINSSMGTAVQRFYSIEIGKKDDGKLKRVFSAGLYCHIVVALITFLLTEIFAIFFLSKLQIPPERMLAAHIVFQTSIVQMLLNILSVPYSALLRARERFSSTAIIDIIQAVLRLGVLYLLLIISFDKLISLGFLNLGITIFSVGAYVMLARQHKESHTKPVKDMEIIREMLGFMSLLIVTVMMMVFRDKGIVLLINLFFGLAINAAYAVAMQVNTLVNTFVQNFKSSIVPQMMSAYGAGDKVSMFKLINAGTKITFMLMLMISLPIAAEANYILNLWLKTPPAHTAMLVVLVMINVNIASFTHFLYQGVHATGNITFRQVGTSIIYALNILGIFIVFKLGTNFQAALYVTIICSFLKTCLNIYCAKRFLGYNIAAFLRDCLLPALIVAVLSTVVVYIVRSLMDASFWRLLIVLTISTIAIFGSSMGLMFNKNEREEVLAFATGFFNKFKNKK